MLHHVSIEVAYLERSVAFYERWLGFTMEARMEWENERIAFLKLGTDRLELVQPETFVPSPARTHIAFEVENTDALCNRLRSVRSVRIEEQPVVMANGWKVVFISGPDGELLEFIEIVKNPASGFSASIMGNETYGMEYD
ncbi:VOC family protein [Paenibacillus piri]|nr:VOC family protein [Paenibacillus piri]